MKIVNTNIPDVKIIEPKVFCDDRGFFMETWEQRKFNELVCERTFVQDNHSKSKRGTLRGLHFQSENPQGKLVRVISGKVFDVAVDIRINSATFGQWVGVYLSAENRKQFWIPEGFAHGFYVVSDEAQCLYKCTDYYNANAEHSILWSDPEIGVEWPLDGEPLLSEKDSNACILLDFFIYK